MQRRDSNEDSDIKLSVWSISIAPWITQTHILHPERIPALPRPATARPKMNAIEDCTVAHRIDPMTEIPREITKTVLVE